ncbi:sigma-70 family RNA polymerase sigma factor [Ascidiimonas sp. W6]|uniref:sigma-70 family RNA polymerase sigma factor n=1 Tax=Ascidiimonas meishanensis TaxID=3128903 RepID=UPI0030ECDFCE
MDRQELADLISDDRLRLKTLYDKYRTPFINFGSKYALNEHALSDVYQEAFIALYKKGINGKLDNISNSMQTYLFGIGKFMIYDTLKKNSRQRSLESLLLDGDTTQEKSSGMASLTEEQKLLHSFFKKSATECQQLLVLFYYRGLTIEEIVEHNGYKNTETVSVQKANCLQSLRQLIKPEDHEYDLLIQKHLKKKLNEQEQSTFDALLASNADFKKEVAFLEDFYKIAEVQAEANLRSMLNEFEAIHQPYKKSSKVLWYVAASILVLLAMAYFFTIMQPVSSENLFADSFTPYKNVVHPIARGAQVLDQKTKAFSTYDNRDYEEAATRFTALYNQTKEPYYLFYQANALIANNEINQAIPLLKKHLKTNDPLKEKTPWYLAMSYLKLQDTENAKKYLQLVLDQKKYGYKEAEELLKSL